MIVGDVASGPEEVDAQARWEERARDRVAFGIRLMRWQGIYDNDAYHWGVVWPWGWRVAAFGLGKWVLEIGDLRGLRVTKSGIGDDWQEFWR